MKNKDTQLLEEAYAKVQLNEGLAETFLKPLFTKIIQAVKEKAPEVFNKLASAKTPEELFAMIKPNGAQQHDEGMMDAVNKVKEAASKFFEIINSPTTGMAIHGAIMHALGVIVLASLYIAPMATQAQQQGSADSAGAASIIGLLMMVIGLAAGPHKK